MVSDFKPSSFLAIESAGVVKVACRAYPRCHREHVFSVWHIPQRHNAEKIANPDATTIATELIVPLAFCLKGIKDRNAEMAEIAFVLSGDGEAVNACRRRDHGVFCKRIRTTVQQARIFAKARGVQR